jgi:1,4-dihydroxy-2-naphthoate octaprenyltransferase
MSTHAAATAAPPMGRASIWLSAARPRTLPAGIVPVLVGVAIAYHAGHVDAAVGLVTLAASLLIQIGCNLANDYYDFVSGADNASRLGPLRITQARLAEPATVKRAAFTVLGLAAILGIYLSYVGGWPILVIGVLSIVAALAYSAGPFPLAHHGLGDVFVFVFFGLIAVNGTVFLQIGQVTPLSLISSLPVACLVTAILVVNNLRDIESDRLAGKHTLAVCFGAGFARAECVVLIAASFAALPVLAGIGGARFLMPLAAVPIAYRQIRYLYSRSGAALNQSLAGTAGLHMAYGILFMIGALL